jgi:hypothetical protein
MHQGRHGVSGPEEDWPNRNALKYFCPPDGARDIMATPSPPVTPFKDPLYVPPVKEPDAGPPSPAPDPSRHQLYDAYPPKKYYTIREGEFRRQFHSDYGPRTWVWGFDGASPGPTYHAYYGEPMLVRRGIQDPEAVLAALHLEVRLDDPVDFKVFLNRSADPSGETDANDFVRFVVISGDGNLTPEPVETTSLYLGVAQRVDVIVDFSRFREGDTQYLENRLEQMHGHGPSGRPVTDPEELRANRLMRFDVVGDEVEDPSRIPASSARCRRSTSKRSSVRGRGSSTTSAGSGRSTGCRWTRPGSTPGSRRTRRRCGRSATTAPPGTTRSTAI